MWQNAQQMLQSCELMLWTPCTLSRQDSLWEGKAGSWSDFSKGYRKPVGSLTHKSPSWSTAFPCSHKENSNKAERLHFCKKENNTWLKKMRWKIMLYKVILKKNKSTSAVRRPLQAISHFPTLEPIKQRYFYSTKHQTVWNPQFHQRWCVCVWLVWRDFVYF